MNFTSMNRAAWFLPNNTTSGEATAVKASAGIAPTARRSPESPKEAEASNAIKITDTGGSDSFVCQKLILFRQFH